MMCISGHQMVVKGSSESSQALRGRRLSLASAGARSPAVVGESHGGGRRCELTVSELSVRRALVLTGYSPILSAVVCCFFPCLAASTAL
jgi:hypothetical protein